MATRPTEALSIIPQYNINPYDAVTNPYGFDAGGHIYNHIPSFKYVLQIGNYVADLASEVATNASNLAQAVQSASQSAQAAAQSAQNAAQFDPETYALKSDVYAKTATFSRAESIGSSFALHLHFGG